MDIAETHLNDFFVMRIIFDAKVMKNEERKRKRPVLKVGEGKGIFLSVSENDDGFFLA